MIENSPTPDTKAARSRATGSHLVPENSRTTSAEPPTYPKGNEPKPGQRVKAGPSGSHKSNTQKNTQVPHGLPYKNGKTPGGAGRPAGKVTSVARRRGGSDKSKI